MCCHHMHSGLRIFDLVFDSMHCTWQFDIFKKTGLLKENMTFLKAWDGKEIT